MAGSLQQLKSEGARLPRRAFLAAGLSAITVAGLVVLVLLGGLTAPNTETFQYARASTFATGEEQRFRGFVARALQDNRVAVVIVGHTGSSGDETANLDLSIQRAEAAREIALSLGVPADRITLAGVGGGSPLPRLANEGARAYQARLARVDVTLQVRH